MRIRSHFHLLIFCVLFIVPARAATFTVNAVSEALDISPGDGTCEISTGSGICTLRAAVAEANALSSDDKIVFDPSITTATVFGTSLTINNNGSLTIEGRGSKVSTISAMTSGNSHNSWVSANNRLFIINGANVTIRNLRLLGGRGDSSCDVVCSIVSCPGLGGGSILATGGSLLLDGVLVTEAKSFARGGAISLYGVSGQQNVYRILNSTIYSNEAKSTNAEGGGIYLGGSGQPGLYIVNSTIISNLATATGGRTGGSSDSAVHYAAFGAAIRIDALGAHTDIRNSTIAYNSLATVNAHATFGDVFTSDGGEICGAQGNTISVANSILGGDGSRMRFGGNTFINSWFGIISLGNNIVNGLYHPAGSTWQASDTVNNGNAGLGGLENAGPTPTIHFNDPSGSIARNAGNSDLAVDPYDNSPLTTDQRGAARIFGGTVDVGAVEIYDSITVATNNLPDGNQAGPYSAFIQPTSGIPPYTFALADGSVLPSGLSLNASTGEISGIPSVSGTFNFTIHVTDSNPVQSGASRVRGPLAVGTDQNFQLIIFGPTAASVSVSGRALDTRNRGIAGVKISITGPNGKQRIATTNTFGYYSFDSVAAGRAYVLAASHRHYRFDPGTKLLNVSDQISDADFHIGSPYPQEAVSKKTASRSGP